ncbi:MAG: iron-sulfur cluster repair di-iron protein [Polaribacter sp.]|nr:iron-sulfur cluster repair di-iron protein [Polaribacter sp.]MDG1953744.1 iron-sulfur cluster repair di-iron protein [Polaribacter sp.]MDG2074560.1 iron-sulfur cluster repair di-iron protein [Polaribacter sp.]
MNYIQTKTVADYVIENIKTAHIFKKHEIDFCCGGAVSIQKACEKNNVNFDKLVNELNNLEKNTSYLNDYNKWELDFLIDFIKNTHHKYVEENLTLLKQYGDKVAKVHGPHYSELLEIKELIHVVADELASHMKKEELILFPFIKKLVNAKRDGTKVETPNFGTVDNPIKMMEEDHDNAGDIFKRISELTNTYKTPEGACNTFKALYAKLEEFEDDLHQHVHLENNILFPKAKAIEANL